MRKESSTNFENEKTLKHYCNAVRSLSLISGRWKLSILLALCERDIQYSGFKKILPTISDRVLSLQLKELQQDGLIQKDDIEGNKKYVYRLSSKGKHFEVVIKTLAEWQP